MRIDGPAEVPRISRGRGSITVLHVDDDSELVERTATVLERHNESLCVRTATSVDRALERLDAEDVDCVVSGYDVSERTGLDLLRIVRERRPDLPFILFTSEEIASRAISAGVTDYLRKGTDQDAVLANRIENAVLKHDAERLVEQAYGAMDTVREGIALLGADGQFRYVNQAYADITGYDRATLIGDHWERLYPDDHDEILPAVHRDGRWSGEVTYERADGERVPTNHALACAEDGTVICRVQERSDGRDERRTRRDGRQLVLSVDAADEGILLTLDDDGSVTGWTDGAEEVLGYADGEIFGEHVSTFFPESGRAAELLTAARETGAAVDEGPWVRGDGSQFHAHTTLRVVDSGGETDVDREHDPETEGGIPGGALDVLDDVFYVLDTEGNVVYVNEPAVTGYTRAEIESRDPSELFEPADREGIADGVRHALETGSDERELRLRTADGSYRTYEFRSWTLTDADGEPYRIVGVGRDVSDRTSRERALNELHRTTRELVRAESTAAIATRTVEALADILTLTHAAVHQYVPQDEALAPIEWTSEVEDLIGEPPALGPGSLAWEAFENGEVTHYDDLQNADDLHNESTPLRSELIVPLGNHGVVLVASREPGAFDETDSRLAQLLCENATAALERVEHEAMLREREAELERENARLDEFASLVSHDLRNPLNVASGHLELAQCDDAHLDEATRAIERMETLIDDVLALAREGETVDDAAPIALSTVVERCWANVETGDAELRLVDDRTIVADERRLARMFENLFRNSVEHGPSCGRPQSGESVEHGAAADESTALVVTVGAITGADGVPRGFYVEDDGVGIPPEDRDQVFEAGYSTGADGTGFGLRIVRDIVGAHGWDVECTAGESGGTRFEITGVDVR